MFAQISDHKGKLLSNRNTWGMLIVTEKEADERGDNSWDEDLVTPDNGEHIPSFHKRLSLSYLLL